MPGGSGGSRSGMVFLCAVVLTVGACAGGATGSGGDADTGVGGESASTTAGAAEFPSSTTGENSISAASTVEDPPSSLPAEETTSTTSGPAYSSGESALATPPDVECGTAEGDATTVRVSPAWVTGMTRFLEIRRSMPDRGAINIDYALVKNVTLHVVSADDSGTTFRWTADTFVPPDFVLPLPYLAAVREMIAELPPTVIEYRLAPDGSWMGLLNTEELRAGLLETLDRLVETEPILQDPVKEMRNVYRQADEDELVDLVGGDIRRYHFFDGWEEPIEKPRFAAAEMKGVVFEETFAAEEGIAALYDPDTECYAIVRLLKADNSDVADAILEGIQETASKYIGEEEAARNLELMRQELLDGLEMLDFLTARLDAPEGFVRSVSQIRVYRNPAISFDTVETRWIIDRTGFQGESP